MSFSILMDDGGIGLSRMVGRSSEFDVLRNALERAKQGKGSTLLVAGEAGIGKTRLVTELIEGAEATGVRVLKGWCLAESMEPLMPVKTGLREAGLFHLISGEPPPLVVSSYLVNDAGMLILKAEREESSLDPDIFTSMLKAVGDFVKDSLSMMGKGEEGRLNSLGYEKYRILLQARGTLMLAVVIEGSESEFLIQDMQNTLAGIGGALDDWDGDPAEAVDYTGKVSWFIDSGKYDGKFLVDNPAIIQENLFDNVLLGLQRVSAEHPLIIFLDDLQWADPSTLNLLHYLARNTRGNRILILCTYRPEDILGRDGTHPLETAMQNMSREDLFERLELRRLDPEATGEVVSSVLGRTDLDDEFHRRIYRDTGGTPLFILEVVKLLVEDGTLKRDDAGAWTLTMDPGGLDIPSKVYDVVKRRLDRLMREQKDILECASVVGEEFGSEVVGKTTGINKMELLKNLSEIERIHRLIRSSQQKYVFDHAKVREVLYNGIIEELRREYHRLIAETLADIHAEDEDKVLSELAYHYYEARDPKAGGYLVMAGDRARERYANEEAIRLYTWALDFADEDVKVRTWEKLGDIEFMLSEYERARENFEKAREAAADNETVARMMRKLGDYLTRRGKYDEAVETYNAAILLIDEKSVEAARLLIGEGYTYYYTGKYDKAMSLFLKALVVFKAAGAGETDEGKVLRAIGNIHYLKNELEKALDHFEKSLEVMRGIDDVQGIAAAYNNIGVLHNDWGNTDKALEFYQKSLDTVYPTGAKTFIAQAYNNMGIVYNTTGELDKALEFMEKGLEMEQKAGDARGIAESLNNMGVVYVDLGDRDRAFEYYQKSMEIRESLGDRRGTGFSYYNMGNMYASREDHERSEEFYLKSLDICSELGDGSMAVYNLSALASLSIDRGDLPAALDHARKAVETATGMDRNFETGMARRAWAWSSGR
ncbi:MAG: hypothetical protein AYK23_04070 [Candidatus Proteinoplasmatales archaeon SG8-5]|nr:MAG: hypothetical protein AYK23_04070 [Candidatus Proteinoplasmatales archaeon SG8-5]